MITSGTHKDAGASRDTTYAYDMLNQVNTITYPSPLGTEGFGYDSVGSLLWKKDGNNKYTVYKYDDLHRLTDVYYNYDPGRGLSPPDYSGLTASVAYVYYGGTGLVYTMADASGDSIYVYDTQGRLADYTPPLPSGHAPVTYGYNNLGQKTSMSTTGLNMAYNYFANGWLKDVQAGGNTVASYTYNWVGNRTGVVFGNGTWQTYDYKPVDPRYLLETINYAYNCGSGIDDRGGLKFTRDNSGNPLNWGDIDNIYKRVYGYDKNSRLESVTYPGQPVVDFTYDWVGNRSLSGSVYNAADQLASANGHAYGYDGAGNLATVDSVPRYDYTFDHLLHTAGSASMSWDAAGNRVSFRSLTDYNHPYDFVYDPTAGIPAVIEETHNGTSVYYVREPGGGLICRINGATTQYYHFDDLGSALFLTGSDGSITDKYRYDAWGNATHDTGTTQQPYQYVGQLGYYTHYQDPNMAGLLQLGVRFYDPETGRFTQEDPIGDAISSYGYAGGNPVSNIDPGGLTYWDAKNAFQRYGESIVSVANEYGIQPELLGGAVYAEQYAGGYPALWNELASEGKFLAFYSSSFGVTQFTQDPSEIDSCYTFGGRVTYLRNYLNDPKAQLRNAAGLLRNLAKRRYGNGLGRLRYSEMGVVLTEYNRGRTNTPNYLAMPSERYGRLALSAMPDIQKWLGLKPINR